MDPTSECGTGQYTKNRKHNTTTKKATQKRKGDKMASDICVTI
jgi:hypothetical protein